MTTRAELRGALRLRLEDTAAGPLWDDAVLDEALAGAVRTYGVWAPKEAVASVAVEAGARQAAVSVPGGGGIDPARIVRVLDPDGAVVPRRGDGEAGPGAAVGAGGHGGRWGGGALLFRRPAVGGSWRIELLVPRAVPTDDAGAVDLLPGDEEVVLALAAAAALGRRAVEDGKRGGRPGGLAALAEAARSEARRLLAARRRRARGGWLE